MDEPIHLRESILAGVIFSPVMRAIGMSEEEIASMLQFVQDKYPVVRYELERHLQEGSVVLQRARRNNEVLGWWISRAEFSFGDTYLLPKESRRKDGCIFLESVDVKDEDLQPYLWTTPVEAFVWWEANRENIVIFNLDRIRLGSRINEQEEE
jgi:hypothetical protein